MSLAERKQLLALACMADRVAWVQACEPAPQPPMAKAGRLLQMIEPFVGLLPGKIGRWVRNIHFAGSLLPHLGKLLLKQLAGEPDPSASTATAAGAAVNGASAPSARTESGGSLARPDKPRSRRAAGS